MPVGGIFGALISGKLANRYGRRKTLMIADLIGIFFGLFTIIPQTPFFGIGRFFSGMSIGAFGSINPLYMSEIAPPEMRGKVGSLTCLQIGLGLVISFSFSMMLPTENLDSDKDNDL